MAGDSHSYTVTKKDGRKVVRTITKKRRKSKSGKRVTTSTIKENNTEIATMRERDGKVDLEKPTPQSNITPEQQSQVYQSINQSTATPEQLNKLRRENQRAAEQKEYIAYVQKNNEQYISQEVQSKTSQQQSTSPVNTIDAEVKPKGFKRVEYELDKAIDKSQQVQAAGSSAAPLVAGATYLGLRAGKGAYNLGAFVVTSPIIAYETSPLTTAVRNTRTIIREGPKKGIKTIGQRNRAQILGASIIIGNTLIAAGRDPFGAAAEFGGANIAFKGLQIGTAGARSVSRSGLSVVNGKTTVDMVKTSSGTYAQNSFSQRASSVVDDLNAWKGPQWVFRGDTTAKARLPRMRSSAGGRGKKLTAKRGPDMRVNNQRFRVYTQKTGRLNDYAKPEKKTFVREIGPRAPNPLNKRDWSAGGLRIQRVPRKPRPTQTVNNNNQNVVNVNNQKMVQFQKNQASYNNGKNFKKLRSQPIVQKNPPPKYVVRISESNKVQTQSSQGQASVVLNRQKPIRIVDDAFDTAKADVPKLKSAGRRKAPQVNSDLTMRQKDFRLNLLKKYAQRNAPSNVKTLVVQPPKTIVKVATQGVQSGFDQSKLAAFSRAMSVSGTRGLTVSAAASSGAPVYGSVSVAGSNAPARGTPVEDIARENIPGVGRGVAYSRERVLGSTRADLSGQSLGKASNRLFEQSNKLGQGVGNSYVGLLDSTVIQSRLNAQSRIQAREQTQSQDNALIQDNQQISGQQQIIDSTPIYGVSGGFTPFIPKGSTPKPPTPIIPEPSIFIPENPIITTTTGAPPAFPKLKFRETTRNQDVAAQVRVKGRFRTIGIGAASSVIGKAKKLIDNTPLASARLMNQQTGEVISGNNLFGRKFRASKRESGVYVEKNKFRIDTSGEVSGISLKGGKKKYRGFKWSI